jgi:hypothetical protein
MSSRHERVLVMYGKRAPRRVQRPVPASAAAGGRAQWSSASVTVACSAGGRGGRRRAHTGPAASTHSGLLQRAQ